MINEILLKRRSTVLFDTKSIEDAILESLFEAARWAPSSRNTQPWRFVYSVRGDEFHASMIECLNSANRIWASHAPVLLHTVAQVVSDYKDQENIYAWHDTAMAYSNLVYEATDRGLYVHPMGGFDRDMARSVLHIPERYEPVIFAALGYKSENPSKFSTELIDREARQRVRKPINELLFYGRFGTEAGFKSKQ
ncbi:MAG: nitroreductase family protein [Bacteroidales bacterium]|nr:nitroreductase family protein [Bacteroidales bacterium]